jgi:hypothetical protein
MSAQWDSIAVVRDANFKLEFENTEDLCFDKGPNFA